MPMPPSIFGEPPPAMMVLLPSPPKIKVPGHGSLPTVMVSLPSPPEIVMARTADAANVWATPLIVYWPLARWTAIWSPAPSA